MILQPPPLPERVLEASRRVRELEAVYHAAQENYRVLSEQLEEAKVWSSDVWRDLNEAQRELLDLIARGEGPL